MNDAARDRAAHTQPTIALALGAGGARGLAHIVVLDAFDELGIKPAVIAGSSMGAVTGAAYAAGVSARQIRSHAERLLHDRAPVMAALVEARTGRLADMIARGNPLLIDGERFLDRLWPNILPERFEDLRLPFLAVATDYYGRTERSFMQDRCCPPSRTRWQSRASSSRSGTAGASWWTGVRSILSPSTISSAEPGCRSLSTSPAARAPIRPARPAAS